MYSGNHLIDGDDGSNCFSPKHDSRNCPHCNEEEKKICDECKKEEEYCECCVECNLSPERCKCEF